MLPTSITAFVGYLRLSTIANSFAWCMEVNAFWMSIQVRYMYLFVSLASSRVDSTVLNLSSCVSLWPKSLLAEAQFLMFPPQLVRIDIKVSVYSLYIVLASVICLQFERTKGLCFMCKKMGLIQFSFCLQPCWNNKKHIYWQSGGRVLIISLGMLYSHGSLHWASLLRLLSHTSREKL